MRGAGGGTALVSRAATVLRLAPALAVVGVLFLGGLGSALAQSLGYQPYLGSRPLGLSAYRALAGDPAVRQGLVLTVTVAVVATVASTVLGIALALLVRAVGRRSPRRRRRGVRLLQVNLAVPHLVGALAIGALVAPTGWLARLAHAVGLVGSPDDVWVLTGDRWGVGIALEYVWKETPFLAVVTLGALGRRADELECAAAVLGARRWQRLRHVTLPMIAPSVAAGSSLVLAFVLGAYEVPLLLGRPFPAPLAVVAYQYATDTDLTLRPLAMAVAVLLTVLSVVAVAGWLRLVRGVRGRSW